MADLAKIPGLQRLAERTQGRRPRLHRGPGRTGEPGTPLLRRGRPDRPAGAGHASGPTVGGPMHPRTARTWPA